MGDENKGARQRVTPTPLSEGDARLMAAYKKRGLTEQERLAYALAARRANRPREPHFYNTKTNFKPLVHVKEYYEPPIKESLGKMNSAEEPLRPPKNVNVTTEPNSINEPGKFMVPRIRQLRTLKRLDNPDVESPQSPFNNSVDMSAESPQSPFNNSVDMSAESPQRPFNNSVDMSAESPQRPFISPVVSPQQYPRDYKGTFINSKNKDKNMFETDEGPSGGKTKRLKRRKTKRLKRRKSIRPHR
jgi:hypothetical protein